MNALELLADLQRRGVHLAAHGDRLRVDAPNGVVTQADRVALAALKPDVLALLAVEPVSPEIPVDDLDAGRSGRLRHEQLAHAGSTVNWCWRPPAHDERQSAPAGFWTCPVCDGRG